MARDHARIRLDIWTDDDWRDLSAGAQWLYMRLLSHGGLSFAGVVEWRPGRLAAGAADLRAADVEMYAAELLAGRFVRTRPQDVRPARPVRARVDRHPRGRHLPRLQRPGRARRLEGALMTNDDLCPHGFEPRYQHRCVHCRLEATRAQDAATRPDPRAAAAGDTQEDER